MNTVSHKSPPPRMTVEEFFAWDGGGHGRKAANLSMAWCVPWRRQVHALPSSRAIWSLRFIITCVVVAALAGSPLRRRIRPAIGNRSSNTRAPDVAVTCAPPSASKTFDDPVLIIEVLSPGNVEETWESIRALAPLPTLTEIVVVGSEAVGIEIYRKDSRGAWSETPEELTDGVIHLASIGLDLAVAEIYRGTHLA